MEDIQKLNHYFTDIYYHLHPEQTDKLTHQALRILQQIQKEHKTTISDVANRANISHNTASEHVKRLIQKGYLLKSRSKDDERIVFLTLTEEGVKTIKENTELDEGKLTSLFQHLSVSEKETILKGFETLAKSLHLR
jgi:MarR family transcriptional regulator, organic hydroperoxide resistance regulator